MVYTFWSSADKQQKHAINVESIYLYVKNQIPETKWLRVIQEVLAHHFRIVLQNSVSMLFCYAILTGNTKVE